MNQDVITGRVLWYDASRGYGFVRQCDTGAHVFLPKDALDAYGLSGVPVGAEIAFNAIQGANSAKVALIHKLKGLHTLC